MLTRESYLSKIRGFYNSDLVKILVGIRRCGKSVILQQIIKELKDDGVEEDHIIDVNFEFIEYEELKDYKKLNTYIKDKIKDLEQYEDVLIRNDILILAHSGMQRKAVEEIENLPYDYSESYRDKLREAVTRVVR